MIKRILITFGIIIWALLLIPGLILHIIVFIFTGKHWVLELFAKVTEYFDTTNYNHHDRHP